MSDAIDGFRDQKELRLLMRKQFGKPCPECQRLLPKAHPKILLPGEFCRMHKFTDSRPEPTNAEVNRAFAPFGWSINPEKQS